MVVGASLDQPVAVGSSASVAMDTEDAGASTVRIYSTSLKKCRHVITIFCLDPGSGYFLGRKLAPILAARQNWAEKIT